MAGYIEITVSVDGAEIGEQFFDDGEETEAEAFREGIVMLGKMTPQIVDMRVLYHGHPAEYLGAPVDDCTCAEEESSGWVWTNDKSVVCKF